MRSTLNSPRLARAVVLGAPLALIFILNLGPLAITLVVSFWQKVGFSMRPATSLENYAVFFSGTRLDVFLRSLWVGVSSATVMLLLAYPIAYMIATRLRAALVRPVLFLFAVPFLVNYVVRTFSWSELLSRTGPINTSLVALGITERPLDWLLYSDFAVYLGLITAYMPFMVFPIWLSLSGIDRRLVEASWMLGEGPLTTFRRVVLPLSMPGVMAAAIFGFVGAFGEVAVSLILGGTGYQLLGNTIQSALNTLDYPLAAAISSVATLLMLALIMLWARVFDLRLLLGKIMGGT
ncbi:ABC transporter permease [Roseovarius tibetensis]|uniref:ABC transporter permease n=1 Tax=Roseovarius tibetensis TaxID=2685897 RepID=UPI003D7F285D